MKHFLQIASGVDVAPLIAAIDAQPELWDSHRERKESDGSPHARMSDIWIRYNDKARYKDRESFNAEHVPVWYPAWHALPELRPIIFGLMAAVDGEMLGGVLITRIPPGGGIAPHVDQGWHVEYYDKFYVSLRSDPGAEFWCDHGCIAEALNPKVGDIWRFDNRKNHWVENNSSTDRVTLIVCIRTDKFK